MGGWLVQPGNRRLCAGRARWTDRRSPPALATRGTAMISRRVWIAMIVLTLAYALGIALDLSPLLRGPIEWRWPRADVQYWDRLWPIALAWLATLGWAIAIERMIRQTQRPRRWLILGLVGLMLASIVVQ